MPTSNLADKAIVFDLDDTLYPEESYVRSGIAAACRLVKAVSGVDHTAMLMALRDAGQRDWLTTLCETLSPACSMRESLLWAYRLHEPDIFLSSEVRQSIAALVRLSKGVAVLTDGRSLTQRLKLRALGLADLPAYISDEHGSADKPDPRRFHAIMHDIPASGYFYIADNPAKDFIAPKALGWQTFGIIGPTTRVHEWKGLIPEVYQPDSWATTLEELLTGWDLG